MRLYLYIIYESIDLIVDDIYTLFAKAMRVYLYIIYETTSIHYLYIIYESISIHYL